MKTAGIHRCSARWLVLIGCASVLVLLPCHIAQAGNIFDDNWTPPKPAVPAATPSANPDSPARTPIPPRPVTSTPPEKTPTETPVSVAPPTPAIVIRKPIPTKGDLTRSRTTLKEVFAAPMKDSSLAGRRKLAEQLFDAVTKTSDNPVDQYVLLAATINAAKEGANLPLCLRAADRLSGLFDVDALAMKREAALSMPLKASSPADTTENLRAALDLVNALVADDDMMAASRLCGLIKPLADTDATLRPMAALRANEVAVLRSAQERLAPALETLKTSADDPAANLVIGKYYCFARGRWDTGLPYLFKGGDAVLKKVAADELAAETSPEANASVGDAWWTIAEKQTEPARSKVREHAATFYKVAVRSVTGLAKLKMEGRIAQVAEEVANRGAAAGSNPVSILDQLKPIGHATAQKTDDGLVVKSDDLKSETKVVTTQEFKPPLVITAVAKTETMQIRLYYGKSGFILFNWKEQPDTLRHIDPKTNVVTDFPGNRIPPNTWVTVRWIITAHESRVEVNGVERASIKGDYSNVSSPVGIGTNHDSVVTFKSLTISSTIPAAGVQPAPPGTAAGR